MHLLSHNTKCVTSGEENKAVTLWEEEFWDISSLFVCVIRND
jgi:hypothetical protein